MMSLFPTATLATLAAVALTSSVAPTHAAPAVAADIAPVHSLVARVMQGVGEPALIVPPGASEHHLALKPSQSAALAGAEVVFWVGPELEPWLEAPLQTLAGDAQVVPLLHSPGTNLLPPRVDAAFEQHVHGESDGSAAHHGVGEGEEHDHVHHAHETDRPEDAGQPAPAPGGDHAHADHDLQDAESVPALPQDSDGHAGDLSDHDHGDADGSNQSESGRVDPHAWLDPGNAEAWLGTIAEALSAADPANAAIYARNAEAGRAELAALDGEIAARLAPVKGVPFVVFHDAYQYLEDRYDLSAAGSISLADGSAPGPARLAAIRAKVQSMSVACALSEPQYDPGLIETVFEGMEVRTGVLDPLGASLESGAKLYPALMRAMATSLADCAG